jgi:hypothetical protein
VLVDLRGTVWCTVLDGVSTRSCALSPVIHELQLTHASVPLSSVLDLLEAWDVSSALCDLDFGKLVEDGLSEYMTPPGYIHGHRAKQAFIAAAGVRQYAWMYAGAVRVHAPSRHCAKARVHAVLRSALLSRAVVCGVQAARATGSVLDLINLQAAGLLASRYLLFDAFTMRSSTCTAWAALDMMLNYDRATGPSHANLDRLLQLASQRSLAESELLLGMAREYMDAMAARGWVRIDPETGARPCSVGGLPPTHALSEMKPRPGSYAAMEEAARAAEEGAADGGDAGRAAAEVAMGSYGMGHLRIPDTDCSLQANARRNMDEAEFARLMKTYNEGLRRELEKMAVCAKEDELGKGTGGVMAKTMELFICVRNRDGALTTLNAFKQTVRRASTAAGTELIEQSGSPLQPSLQGTEVADWLPEFLRVANEVRQDEGVPDGEGEKQRRPVLVSMRGANVDDTGTVLFSESEQAKLNSYLCQRLAVLTSMEMPAEDDEAAAPPRLIAMRVSASELHEASTNELAMLAGQVWAD